MALVRSFEEKCMERNSLHEEIAATYSVFERDGQVLLQIDTYGRLDRDLPGKKSQSIQLDLKGAKALRSILNEAFGI